MRGYGMSGVEEIGQKGGTSATAGRKAEVIEAIIDGVTYSKRVFFGQRVLLVYFSDRREPLITAWRDFAAAEENARGAEERGSRYIIREATVRGGASDNKQVR